MHPYNYEHDMPLHYLSHTKLAHRPGQDSTQQGEEGRRRRRHHKTGTGRGILSPTPVALSFVVPARSGGRALTKPDPIYTTQATGERQYLTNSMGRQTLPREVGRRGEGLVVGAAANARSQGAGRPREKGKRPVLTIGRDSTTTTIGRTPAVE
jgi:hypothetical protein